MATAKQKAWRKKFASLYAGKKHHAKRGASTMSRHRKGHRHRRGQFALGGIIGMVVQVIAGYTGASIKDKIPVLNKQQADIGNATAGAGAGALVGKFTGSWKRGAIIGAIAGAILPKILGGTITQFKVGTNPYNL